MLGSSRNGLYFLCSSCLKNVKKVNGNSICCLSGSSSFFSNSTVSRTCISSDIDSCHVDKCKLLNTDGPLVCTSTSNSNNKSVLFDKNACVTARNNVDLLWHTRLGHVPFVKMRNISTLSTNFSPKQPFMCTICLMTRQERLPFSHSTSQTKSKFEILHVDLWGPYHISVKCYMVGCS